jgi:hypothetical protein
LPQVPPRITGRRPPPPSGIRRRTGPLPPHPE